MSQLQLVTPTEHFKEKVCHAAKNLNFPVTPDVEFYLVTLLCNFIKPTESLELSTPLALRLKAAEESGIAETKQLKDLGDTALYLAGFFQDYFNRKTYDIGYYIAMGSSAYLKLSESTRNREGLYRNLGETFVNLVDIVATVAEDVPVPRDLNILATYDRWTRTGSERLRRILEKEGITPVEVNMNKVQ